MAGQDEFTGYGGLTFEVAAKQRGALERMDRDRLDRGEVAYVVRPVWFSDGGRGFRVYREFPTEGQF